jgi:hypothetical protein
LSIGALLATGAAAQDRPDLMDLFVDDSGVGGSAPLADSGKGKPLNGSRNRIDSGNLDFNYYSYYNYVSGVLTGMVPETAEGGVTVQLIWTTNEPDKVQRGAKSGKIDQKAHLGFAALILTSEGDLAYSTTTTGSPPVTNFNPFFFGYDAIEDCSAKFSAKGVPTAVGADAPRPTSAKWSAKCKQATLTSILNAIGVPAAQQTTIQAGLGIEAGDKISIKGGF